MSIKTDPGEYGRKMATIEQLIQFINDGDTESKGELQKRLPTELASLRTLYQVAYGIDDADKTLIAHLASLKPSSNYKEIPHNSAWTLN
ncbi:hypothetical protein JHL22_06595 [Advenella sp. WQ 585]|uniref:Uncharacterized protein n=1 Tax=Advenella mandrilli TaxID=2800330 RepID=A0ABS1EEZ6_9BURK|nr:hypothetical protein [Advenella mandrilli]MBK1780881.1 hypothetical protein [Advenella mandrilli]